jgi:hypothetical protein
MREPILPEPDNDPLDQALLPSGAAGNHGLDLEISGLRPRACHTDDGRTMLRCADGVGWCVDAFGQRELYPSVGEAVFHIPADEVDEAELAALAAWCDEGVPVRLRGVVGTDPTLAFDDGHRLVLLPRASLRWSLSADETPARRRRAL